MRRCASRRQSFGMIFHETKLSGIWRFTCETGPARVPCAHLVPERHDSVSGLLLLQSQDQICFKEELHENENIVDRP